jgi:hypothetical protein
MVLENLQAVEDTFYSTMASPRRSEGLRSIWFHSALPQCRESFFSGLKNIFGAKSGHFAAMPPVTTNAMPWLGVDDEWPPGQKQMIAAGLEQLSAEGEHPSGGVKKRKAEGNCERKVPGFGGERHLTWGPNDERRLDEARNGPARLVSLFKEAVRLKQSKLNCLRS